MCQVVEWLDFLSILPWATDMSRSTPDLSVSMSFSSSPVTYCWVLEELFAVTDTLRYFGPRFLGYHKFAKFVLCIQYRSAKLAPATKPIHQVLPLKVSRFLRLSIRITSLLGVLIRILAGLAGN